MSPVFLTSIRCYSLFSTYSTTFRCHPFLLSDSLSSSFLPYHEKMTKISTTLFLIFFSLLLSSNSSNCLSRNFIKCLSETFPSNISAVSTLYVPSNSSYEPILESSIQNLRYLNNSSPKPLAIITPLFYSHVQSAIVCSKRNGLRIRIRSGGHDYEGLSYAPQFPFNFPFIIIDLSNLRSVKVNVENKTAWVESGATLGELYYWIANKTNIHGFPAGICPSVGAGGQISGGGIGSLSRKYGLAADNVIDALIVDVNGEILNKESMGKDLFWAIRGGGAASFEVVLAWKIKLVYVPPLVTVFKLSKTLEQGAIDLIQKWQHFAPNASEDLRLSLGISKRNGTTRATISAMFLGRPNDLITLMEENFPEYELKNEDCQEMSWINSVLYYSHYPNPETKDALRNRKPLPRHYFKAKSDFVVEPLSDTTLKGLWKWCSKKENLEVALHPYGGRLSEIPESETPFPFRQEILYGIDYLLTWDEDDSETSRENINWIRELYEYMTPFVSKSPRGAFWNYRDLDLGINDVSSSYLEATKWGVKYFKHNFKHLAMVKARVDRENFFTYEQSIPPFKVSKPRREQRHPLSAAAL